jgi:hypothetical protein
LPQRHLEEIAIPSKIINIAEPSSIEQSLGKHNLFLLEFPNMSTLPQATIVLSLLAVALAPLPALAHNDNDGYSSGSGATVIRYDPNSSEDIYENHNGGQYQAHGWGHNNGRHYGQKKKKRKHHNSRFGDNRNNTYNDNRDNSYDHGRFGGGNNQPQSTQNGRTCVSSRFGTVCR